MITKEEILARLKKGETADNIADELIKTLNSANDIYIQEQKAKEANEIKKNNEMQYIIDTIYDFCRSWYCETDEDVKTLDEVFDHLDAKSVLANIEVFSAYAAELNDFAEQFNKVVPENNCKSADAVLADFINSLGL